MAHNKFTMAITQTARGRGSILAASIRAFLRFNRGLLTMPPYLQGWVLMLVGANIVAPTFFFEHTEARVEGQMAALNAMGVDIIQVTTSEPYDRPLQRFFERRAKRLRR